MTGIVKAVGRGLRNLLLSAAAGLDRLGGTKTASAGKAFEHVDVDGLLADVAAHPTWLLQIREIRGKMAKERVSKLMAAKGVQRVAGDTPAVAHNTLDYNLEGAISAPDMDRPDSIIGVAMGIEKIRKNAPALDILSIGPRSESELFSLWGSGFNPERTKALDLFSYSPFVDVGDMHDMPYPDNSFDLVLVGWVLSYSKDQQRAATEFMRVCKPGGVIILAGDYSDDTRDRSTFSGETTHMQSVDQLLKLFDGHVGEVYSSHNPRLPEIRMVMTAFEITK